MQTPFILMLLAASAAATEAPSLDLFVNYTTVGVTRCALGTSDPQKDGWASLEYGLAVDELAEGFSLSRVDNGFGRLSGWVFWCEPATTNHVAPEFS